MRANKYFNDTYSHIWYEYDKQLVLFLIDIDNILDEIYSKKMIWIRFRDQKELLEVLKFILDNYRLYTIESWYLEWRVFENNFHPKSIWAREAMVASLIYELQGNLWYYDELSLNICTDYLTRYKTHLQENNISELNIIMALKSDVIFSSRYIRK
jgi:hypothetical protein